MRKPILLLALLTAGTSWSQTALSPRQTALQPALVLTNQFGTNIFPTNLASQLSNLQNDLQQMLPLLANFNDTFEFIRTGAPSAPTAANLGNPPGPAVNLSENLATAAGQGLGLSLGQNLAVSTGSSGLALTPPGGSLPAVNGSGTVSLGVPQVVGLVPGPGVSFSSSRDALRALLILQNDLERLLPILATVNAATNLTVGANGE